jgi:hypothetical protein
MDLTVERIVELRRALKAIMKAHPDEGFSMRLSGGEAKQELMEILDLAEKTLKARDNRSIDYFDLKKMRDETYRPTTRDMRKLLTAYEAMSQFCAVVMTERDHAQQVEVPDALEQRDRAVAVVRTLFEPACVVCECLLEGPLDLGATEPPHCIDCNVPDEEVVIWENETKPELCRAISIVLGKDTIDP